MGKFKFIDLFAGIGGLRYGFSKIGGECVFTSEWDKFAQTTYRANFGDEHGIDGDITKIKEEDVPAHDVLLAGFPCQAFSMGGKKRGFEDTRGTLFFDVARIIKHHKPRTFLLENVKNLVHHDEGKTFKIILGTLDELGYAVHHRVISAEHWVPQRRKRTFIVGFRKEDGVQFDFNALDVPQHGPLLATVLHPEDGSEISETPYTQGETATVNPKYGLSEKVWEYLKSHAAKHRERGNGFGYGLVTGADVARTLSARYGKDGSEILVDRPNSPTPRRLTPRECARLMGFDAPKKSQWVIPVSDTQAYKQFGNSVSPPVSFAIARHMLPHVVQEESQIS